MTYWVTNKLVTLKKLCRMLVPPILFFSCSYLRMMSLMVLTISSMEAAMVMARRWQGCSHRGRDLEEDSGSVEWWFFLIQILDPSFIHHCHQWYVVTELVEDGGVGDGGTLSGVLWGPSSPSPLQSPQTLRSTPSVPLGGILDNCS